jgi:hypothetical protein
MWMNWGRSVPNWKLLVSCMLMYSSDISLIVSQWWELEPYLTWIGFLAFIVWKVLLLFQTLVHSLTLISMQNPIVFIRLLNSYLTLLLFNYARSTVRHQTLFN